MLEWHDSVVVYQRREEGGGGGCDYLANVVQNCVHRGLLRLLSNILVLIISTITVFSLPLGLSGAGRRCFHSTGRRTKLARAYVCSRTQVSSSGIKRKGKKMGGVRKMLLSSVPRDGEF